MLVIIRKYFLAILILFVCVFFFAFGMALVEVETRGGKNRSRSRSNRTNLSSVLASSFLTFLCCEPPCVQPVDFDFTTLSYLKPIACVSRHRSITFTAPFSITLEREHVHSTKVLRNVVMHLWNSEADVMLKTLITRCMPFFLFLRMFSNFLGAICF